MIKIQIYHVGDFLYLNKLVCSVSFLFSFIILINSLYKKLITSQKYHQ